MYPPMAAFIRKFWYLHIIFTVITMFLMYAIVCFRQVARTVPINYIALGLYTLFDTGAVVCFAAWFDIINVVFCMGAAILMFICLTLISCFTKQKPKWWAIIIPTCFFATIPLLFMMIFFWTYWVGIIVSCILLVITCIYVVFDVYLITSKHGLEYDDYVLGALLLYMDMIQLFILLLMLVGSARD